MVMESLDFINESALQRQLSSLIQSVNYDKILACRIGSMGWFGCVTFEDTHPKVRQGQLSKNYSPVDQNASRIYVMSHQRWTESRVFGVVYVYKEILCGIVDTFDEEMKVILFWLFIPKLLPGSCEC